MISAYTLNMLHANWFTYVRCFLMGRLMLYAACIMVRNTNVIFVDMQRLPSF